MKLTKTFASASLPPLLLQLTLPHSQDPIWFFLLPLSQVGKHWPRANILTYTKLKWNMFCPSASFSFSDNFYLKLYNDSEAEHDKIVELAPDLGAKTLPLTLGESHYDCVKVTKAQKQELRFIWPPICSMMISGSS